MTVSIQYYLPESLSDEDEGGGSITSNVYPDNTSNALFPPIADIDNLGQVSIRKLFPAPISADATVFYGGYFYLTNPPDNTHVSILFMPATSFADHRSDIADAAAAYLLRSINSTLTLVGSYQSNGRVLLAYQLASDTDPLPEPGQVYCLSAADEQYIRVQGVNWIDREFTDTNGNFTRRLVTLTLTEPLRYAFVGLSTPSRYSSASAPTAIKDVYPSESSVYYGIRPFRASASAGAVTVAVDSIFSPLAPASVVEQSLIDVQAGLVGSQLLPLTSEAVTLRSGTSGSSITIGTALFPGSVTATGGGVTLHDDSLGHAVGGQYSATVNYRDGSIAGLPNNGPWTITAIPATSDTGQCFTVALPVTVQTRGTNWIQTLDPPPTLDSVVVTARILGKWYSLYGTATGELVGIAGTGTGLVIAETGTVNIVWASPPDLGTAVIISWQSRIATTIRAGALTAGMVSVQSALTPPIDPTGFTITWTANSITKTANSGALGVISGDATGRVFGNHLALYPTLLPDANSPLSAVGYVSDQRTYEYSGTVTDYWVTFTLPEHPVKVGAVFTIPAQYPLPSIIVTDGGDQYLSDGVSTINRTTGDVHLYVRGSSASEGSYHYAAGSSVAFSYWPVEPVITYYQVWDPARGDISVAYATEADTWVEESEDTTIDALALDFSSITANEPLISYGVRFTLGGVSYYDDGHGVLRRVLSNSTGDNSAAGTIDYATAIGSITSWLANASLAGTYALRVKTGNIYTASVTGRMTGGNIRPGSFQVRALTFDDDQLTATAATNGTITATDIKGTIDMATGIYALEFGALVLDSSLTNDEKAQPWYDADNIDGTGHIWKPLAVQPATILLNAVVTRNIPLSSELVGLDTVRLPEDGRVPIYGEGRPVVAHNTQDFEMPDNLTQGQIIDLERVRLAVVVLYDQDDILIPANRYSVNLALGLVTMATPLNLSGFTQPLIARHTVETLATLLDVQLDGTCNISVPLGHDYPLEGSYLSSAYIAGNRFARVPWLFSQHTWTSVWSDSLIGDGTDAQYNDIDYPLIVTNESCIDGNWALVFVSTTQVSVREQTIGVLGSFSILDDIAPVNHLTGEIYFTIDKDGWGTGWSTNNVVRFRTISAAFGVHFFRSISPELPYNYGDQFSWTLRGNLLP